jgi:hypothetical protein
MKTCTKCKIEKQDDCFYIDRGKLMPRCKECTKEARRLFIIANPEKEAAHQRQYREKNRAALNEKNKKWASENKELMQQYKKKWRDCNKEKAKEIEKNWAMNNKEKRSGYLKKKIQELRDNYVAHRIIAGSTLQISDVPQALIELKRQHILLKREIKRIDT